MTRVRPKRVEKKPVFYGRRVGPGTRWRLLGGGRKKGGSDSPEGIIGGNRKRCTFCFPLQVYLRARRPRVFLSLWLAHAGIGDFPQPGEIARPVSRAATAQQTPSATDYRSVRVPRFHYWPPPPLGARQSIIRRNRSAACGSFARAHGRGGARETDGLPSKGTNASRVVRTHALTRRGARARGEKRGFRNLV